MKPLAKDETGRRYYVARYTSGCFRKLPWGRRRFDCGIFVHRSASRAQIEECIREVVRRNNDWVCTYGADAEAWHDRVDEASVEVGRQKRVGDGDPMTAWFTKLTSLRHLQMSHCYGAHPYLLLLVGFPSDVRTQIHELAKRLRPNHALQRTRPSRCGCNRGQLWAGSLSSPLR